MDMYVIYLNPGDFPGQYVVRRWTLSALGAIPREGPLYVGVDLAAARRAVPKGLIGCTRHEHDDPAILEVWM